MIFQLVEGGGCLLCQKPATARNHPTQNEEYQACISNAKAMEGRPSRPAFPARRSLAWNPGLCALSRSEPLSARFFFPPSPCSYAEFPHSLRTLARAPLLCHLLSRLCFLFYLMCHSLALSRRASSLLSLLVPLSHYLPPCLLLVATPRLCPPNRCIHHV